MCAMNSEDEDEDDLIEAEIQRQLKLLTFSENDLTQNEEDDLQMDENEDVDIVWEYDDEQIAGSKMPDSIQNYLDIVNKRSDGLQRDLEECQHLLTNTVKGLGNDDFYYQSAEMKEIAFILGEDPEELRDRVLTEVEEEEKKEADKLAEHMTDHVTDAVVITTDSQHLEMHQTDGDYIVSRAADTLEQAAWQELLQLDDKLKQRHLDMQQDIQHQVKQQALRDEQKDQNRSRKQKQHTDELKQLQQDRRIFQAKAEQEFELETKKNQEVLDKHRADIEEFAKQTEEERLEFECHLAADREYKLMQKHHAATVIQAALRSYRVRKKYHSRLHRLREERQQRQFQNRQMEIVALRRAEEQRKKREKVERKQREEEDRRRTEEMQRQAEEERLKQERLEKEKLEQERKRLEILEQQRLEEEKKQHEEQLKQEKELEERTREILSKIREERTGIPPQVINEKRDDNETVNDAGMHSDTQQEPREVFITTSKDSQSTVEQTNAVTPNVNEHDVSSSNRTPDRSEETSDATFASVPDTQTQKHSDNTGQLLTGSDQQQTLQLDTSQSEQPDVHRSLKPTNPACLQTSFHSSECDVTDPVQVVRTYKTDKQESSSPCLTEASQGVQSEPTDTNNDNNREAVSSGSLAINKQAITRNVSSVNELEDNDRSLTVPGDIEARRLHWMHNCVSHSSLISGMECNATRKALRRAHGANKLPALTSSQLLATSRPQTELSQVTVVVVKDAAPCSLSSLSSCPHLQCLHVQQSGVILLAGVEHCANISYINLQHNRIEGIHCRDRTQLTQLLLQNNKLTSTHGLEGCTQLRYLQLSNNSITRTGGLESLSSVTHLDISRNQLVSINGLGHLLCLQDLNLSHNHLSTVQELETCCLLQRLNIESNSLVEMPPVQNHVLLRDVKLNDNSLSSIAPLSLAWLPLLQYLSLAQNGLSDLPDMRYCLMLKKLDISQNCITDIDTVVDGLAACYYLEELRLEGNPLTQDETYRYDVLGRLVQVRVLDNEAVKEAASVLTSRNPYVTMCLSQLHAQDQLHTAYQQHAESIGGNILEASQVKTAYMECSLKQAMNQRHMHESGEMTETQHASPGSAESTFYEYISAQTEKCRSDPSSTLAQGGRGHVINHSQTASCECGPADNHNQNASGRHDSVENYAQTASGRHGPVDDSTQTTSDRHGPVGDNTQTASAGRGPQTASNRHGPTGDYTQTTPGGHGSSDDHTHTSCMTTHNPHQSSPVDFTSSPSVISKHATSREKESEPQPQQHREAATTIQARWRGYIVRRDLDVHAKLWLAALRIQALWRGYRVRKMVARARQAVRYHDSDDEEDAMIYDEVDPASWDLAQENLDSDWLPTETPTIPKVHPRVPATHTQSSTNQSVLQHTPQPPRQAWYASPIPHTGYTAGDTHSPMSSQLASKPPIPPVHTSPGSDTPRSTKSHKQDQLSQEWGFKDATTAELMMKRAKKLTKGGSKKRTLDPLQRYQQMKKVQGPATVAPSPKRGVQRQEFFQAREQVIQKAITAQRKEKEHKQTRTFEWVHSHADVSSDTMIHESGRHSSSEPSLPILSSHALQGRVQLTASPSLELQSVDDASSISSQSFRPRSHSLSSQQAHEDIHFPAIKTNSAPSGRTREQQAVDTNKKVMRGWTSRNNNQV